MSRPSKKKRLRDTRKGRRSLKSKYAAYDPIAAMERSMERRMTYVPPKEVI